MTCAVVLLSNVCKHGITWLLRVYTMQGVTDWQARLLTITRNLGNVTALVNSKVESLLNSTTSTLTGGRRRMQEVGPGAGKPEAGEVRADSVWGVCGWVDGGLAEFVWRHAAAH